MHRDASDHMLLRCRSVPWSDGLNRAIGLDHFELSPLIDEARSNVLLINEFSDLGSEAGQAIMSDEPGHARARP